MAAKIANPAEKTLNSNLKRRGYGMWGITNDLTLLLV